MKTAIFGATSAIAEATARVWAARGYELILIGRQTDKLCAVGDDLKVRGAKQVHCITADLSDLDGHSRLLAEIEQRAGLPELVLIAHGELGSQEKNQADYVATETILRTNFLSPVSLLTSLANAFEKRGSGVLAVISSVAGDRARPSNYIYGTAKGGLSLFLGGLRGRLFPSGVRVITIKPGFVDTPMTAHFRKGLLWAKPASIARGIVRAVDKKRDVVYLPGFWWAILLVIRLMPERLFKRLRW